MTTVPAGLLLIDKPAGPTSFAIVRLVRALVADLFGVRRRKLKVGHTGTLDPFATGLLPICIGPATRLARYITDDRKSYHTTARLGAVTTTDDLEGDVVEQRRVPDTIDRADLERALSGFVGTIAQRPPAYSAIHVNGRRAYELARAGEAVEIPERQVEVHDLTLGSVALPDISFDATVGKGTYIRTLCRDLGERLGTGACCIALRRTMTAGFTLDSALTPDELRRCVEQGPTALMSAILPPHEMLRGMPSVDVDAGTAQRLSNGQRVSNPVATDAEVVAVVARTDDDIRLVCVAEIADGLLRPRTVIG